MRLVNWRIFVPGMLICGVVAWAVHHWFNFPFWTSFGVVVLALVVNGWIAAVEDHW